jgi:signal transduction histidine kinase/CheY-like chemotaxis protein
MNREMKKTTITMSILLAICLCVVFVLFYNLTRQYRKDTAASGASHLMEINFQGKENILSLLTQEQRLTADIKDEMESGGLATEKELIAYIQKHKTLWGADDIYIYTKAGVCVNSVGIVQSNGDSSEFAYETVQAGNTFRIIKSQAEYACSVHTDLTVQDSQIVAISAVDNLDGLLEKLNFKPFGGSGSVYLCRQNGVRICQSAGDGVRVVYNIASLFEAGTTEKLLGNGQALQDIMAAGEEAAFLYKEKGRDAEYVVLTPIRFEGQVLYLLTLVPQAVVNQTINTFSNRVIVLSSVVIVLIILLFIGFFVFYQRRSRRYAEGIRSREHLFDLLVSETSNAFLLFDIRQPEPVYLSSNTEQVLGAANVRLQKRASGFRFDDGTETVKSPALAELNKALADWDGSKPFLSSYLPTSPAEHERRYLRLGLYPFGESHVEYVGIIRDATPEHQREESLQQALSMANSASRAKTRFLSSVSHDIRTPLNAIINMARFLRQDIDNHDKALEEIGVIMQSSKHLLGLINDVLDLSRIESGKLALVNQPFDITETIAGVLKIIQPLCAAKNQDLISQVSGVAHPELIGDSIRLNQILINVLNNAMKFTPERGKIEFLVEELPAIKENFIPFRFTVRDNGIGISPENIRDIFSPFTRDSNAAVRRTEGSGLGLAITKNLVEAQGGTITVESTVGEGSVFVMEICYTANAAAAPDRAPKAESEPCSARFDGLCALVAEDNQINLEIAKTILVQWGFTVETASDGAAAVEKFKASSVGSISIIYMDIQMPVMNGYDAAMAIRGSGRADAASVPIIAMTADAFSEDVERARTAGMNAHTAKPIDPDEVHRVTAEMLRGKGSGHENT